MKQTKLRKPLSFLLALALVVTMFAGMSITAYADAHTYTYSYSTNSWGDPLYLPSYASAGDTLIFPAYGDVKFLNITDGSEEFTPVYVDVGYMAYNYTIPSGHRYNLSNGLSTNAGGEFILRLSVANTITNYNWNNCKVTAANTNGEAITSAFEGDTVTLTVTPAIGYTFNSLAVYGNDGNQISLDNPSTNIYTFTMPNCGVYMNASFTATGKRVYIDDTTGGTVEANSDIANKDETVTLTVTPATGYQYTANSLTVKDADGNTYTTTQDASDKTKYTFTMPDKAVTVSATFTATGNAVTIGTFTGGTVSADKTSSVASGTRVTLTVTPSAGYQFGSLTVKDASDNTVEATQDESDSTKYTFTMPDAAVTVSATFTELATTGDVNLDLEASTDIPSSTTIDQYYIKTTADKTTTNNRIKVSWVTQNIDIKVAAAKKWNPTTLSWDTDTEKDGKASVAEGTNVTTFTFTNYSTKAFTIAPTFAINSSLSDTVKGSLTSATYDQNSYSVAAVDMDEGGVTADKKYFVDQDTTKAVDETKLPSASVVATLNIDASKFDNATATTEAQKYGTYTFTLTAVNGN